jgi:hypothetical protein
MRVLVATLVALLSLTAKLTAQCTGNASVQEVCNRAIDALKTFHPAAGIIVSGGNPSVGSARALGGLGHGFLAVRVNALTVVVPNPDTTTGAAAFEGLVGAPVVEAGVGLSGGFLAVDALFAATLLPTNAVDNLRVDSGATRLGSLALGLGYGARVSVLPGAFPVPAVSLSVMRRSLPRVIYGRLAPSSLSSGDAFEFETDLQATNVRSPRATGSHSWKWRPDSGSTTTRRKAGCAITTTRRSTPLRRCHSIPATPGSSCS